MPVGYGGEERGLKLAPNDSRRPDFWTEQDYKAYATQMAKLRLNFVGLHNYNYYNEVHATRMLNTRGVRE